MTVEKFLDPKNDFAFKKIFGTEKHKDILIHFLNDMLDFKEDKKIVEVSFLKPAKDPDLAGKKQSIVDVLCRDEPGRQYIVEMQVAHSPGFEKRAQFYAARAYVDQMNEGEAYHDLKEIIFLAITNFVMFPEKPGYLSRHVILDNETFTRDLKDFSFTFMELPKFTMTVDQLETLIDKWAYFFKHTSHITPEEFEKFTANDLIFKQAYKALDRFYWTEIELNTYRQETKRILDERVIREHELAMSKAEGKAEGLAEGEAIGTKNAMLKVARQMLNRNVPLEEIKALTNLSDNEIAQLTTTCEIQSR
jgi:predicted transposase/invertase (TIGR01784 family)